MIIPCKKSDLVEAMFRLNNVRYSLEGREPLRVIYDLVEPDIILMMGRQYAKSTFLATDALTNSAIMPFFKTLYVSPRQDQTSEFSNSKLQPFVKYSPTFRKLCIDEESINNVEKKTFKNGSEITLKYAFHTADGIRGISADHATIDEIQDIILGNLPVIEECLSGSPYQWRTYAGTPKTLNNTLAQLWGQSTQNEWVLKCPHCSAYNIIGYENIGPVGLICKRCKKDLPRNSDGQWVSMKSIGPGVYMTGFRVPQVLSPMVKWPKIIEKMNTYSSAKFMNEVLALPFDSSANPITEQDLKDVCFGGESTLKRSKAIEGMHLFLGVDWGHGDVSIRAKRGQCPTGYSAITLGMYDWDGRYQMLGMKRYTGAESDPIFQVNEVCRIANELNVTGIGVDFGGGFLHNRQLKERLGNEKVIEWQANDSLRVSARWIPEAERMLFNRTECMTDRFVEIKNKKVKFCSWETFKPFSPDFLTIYIDYRDDGRSMFYGHVLPDDCFHSYMIGKMTADYLLTH